MKFLSRIIEIQKSKVNWKLVGTTLLIIGLIAEVLILNKREPYCEELGCLLLGTVVIYWALKGALASIFLTFLLSWLIPPLKAKGLRNIVFIFILSLVMIIGLVKIDFIRRLHEDRKRYEAEQGSFTNNIFHSPNGFDVYIPIHWAFSDDNYTTISGPYKGRILNSILLMSSRTLLPGYENENLYYSLRLLFVDGQIVIEHQGFYRDELTPALTEIEAIKNTEEYKTAQEVIKSVRFR